MEIEQFQKLVELWGGVIVTRECACWRLESGLPDPQPTVNTTGRYMVRHPSLPIAIARGLEMMYRQENGGHGGPPHRGESDG